MKTIPMLLSVSMVLTTVATLYAVYRVFGRSKLILVVSSAWLAITAGLGIAGFYTNMQALPPRFIFLVGPPLVGVLLLLLTRTGRKLADNFDGWWGTALHGLRVPVELVLFGLKLSGHVPTIMTFEGRNFDILPGISAIVLCIWMFNKKISRKWLWLFNISGLFFLVNIVSIAILSAPTPFQLLAFDQPNIGVFYFPFVWLPSFIVPAVLACHLLAIRTLLSTRN